MHFSNNHNKKKSKQTQRKPKKKQKRTRLLAPPRGLGQGFRGLRRALGTGLGASAKTDPPPTFASVMFIVVFVLFFLGGVLYITRLLLGASGLGFELHPC